MIPWEHLKSFQVKPVWRSSAHKTQLSCANDVPLITLKAGIKNGLIFNMFENLRGKMARSVPHEASDFAQKVMCKNARQF